MIHEEKNILRVLYGVAAFFGIGVVIALNEEPSPTTEDVECVPKVEVQSEPTPRP